jgi:hypothetical protein
MLVLTPVRLTLPLLLLLSSPTHAAFLDQVPIETCTVRGEYAALASCAFAKLDQVGLKKTDLPNEIRVVLKAGSVRF